MKRLGDQSAYLKQVLLIFIVAVTLNYLWELAQAPLYVGLENWNSVWWHCFVAALGDGILVLLIFVKSSMKVIADQSLYKNTNCSWLRTRQQFFSFVPSSKE